MNLLKRFSATDVSLSGIFIAGFLLLAVTSGGTLLTGQSLQSFFTYLAIPILIGLAQMVVLSIGQMNLAVGAMGGAATAIMAVAMTEGGLPIWLALLVGFLSATAMGAVNGALVVMTNLNGFIITLGTMTILLGVQYSLVRSFTIDSYSEALKGFGRLGLGPIPYIFLIAILTAAVLAFFFTRSAPGRRILATGGNDAAARLSGISNKRSVFLAHTISGMLLGVAAIVTISSLGGINRSIGGDWLLLSFAAPIIGGVLMSGGTVAIYGTVMAAGVIRLVDIARAEYSLDPSVVSFTIGIVVLSTVTLSEWRRRRSEVLRQGRKVLE
ncbi:ABC transporter permease [Salinibacterium sp.]|uniref:ABC transporter permease n=1 Tax=Salinibacterium sp. TaxID=1915057 RepID=UPI00286D207E|nr:ABC transporter permease [Salinibacterium sp.]